MSDSEDSNAPRDLKKKHAALACDECTRRKVKCDGESMPNGLCSRCIRLKKDCTRLVRKMKRGPKSRFLQNEKADAKTLITTILSAPKSVIVSKDETIVRGMLVELASYARNLEQQVKLLEHQIQHSPTSLPETSSTSAESRNNDDDDKDLETLTVRIESLNFDTILQCQHMDKSSHYQLLTLIDSVRQQEGALKQVFSVGIRREEFWTRASWHDVAETDANYPPLVFPPDDLLHALLSAYFDNNHNTLPLFHRATFERRVYVEHLHLRNRRFGEVVLATCALGSRFVDDSRTLQAGSQERRSAGWNYFRQIHLFTIETQNLSLFDIQLYSLALSFLFPTFLHDISWFLSGLGIRAALAMGVHRKSFSLNPQFNRLDQECWRRAFWHIVCMDLYMSFAQGRPRSLREDDFDVELPPDCDDELWEIPSNPELEFIQPVGKFSYMSHWHYYTRLLRIAGLVKDHLYTTRKAAPWLNPLSDDKHVVTELDSALNDWRDSLPPPLKWDPSQPDDILFAQSAMLHTNFYWVQIQIHKIFVRPEGSTSDFPSVAVCANAARSYIHIMQTYGARPGMPMLPLFIVPTFGAATMLLWTCLRNMSSCSPRKDLLDVYSCISILEKYERRYENAGRLRDILEGVLSTSQLPQPSQRTSLKRTREYQHSSEVKELEDVFTRQFAGSQRVSNALSTTRSDGSSVLPTPGLLGGVMSSSIDGADPFQSLHGGDIAGSGIEQHHQQANSMPYPYEASASNISSLGYNHDDPSFSDPRGDASNEEWSSFMSMVDQLLDFVHPNELV